MVAAVEAALAGAKVAAAGAVVAVLQVTAVAAARLETVRQARKCDSSCWNSLGSQQRPSPPCSTRNPCHTHRTNQRWYRTAPNSRPEHQQPAAAHVSWRAHRKKGQPGAPPGAGRARRRKWQQA
eukprot:scaffold7758_cov109-Isochrysis_galbana.AAC.2